MPFAKLFLSNSPIKIVEGEEISEILSSLYNLNKNDVSGPVGVASYVGEAYEEVKDYGASAVIFTTLNFILILAINLGIMNLLPIPALDGGRLVFLLIELIRGKPMPPEKEGMVHFAGMVLFFVIMILVMYNDIMKIITP